MRGTLSQLLALGPELAAFILTTPLLYIPGALAVTQPSPNLDLSQLGHVAVAGDFDGISLYAQDGQITSLSSFNGKQAVLTQDSNGYFENLGLVDAEIMDMCSFVKRDGTFAGVVLCGNFTSVGSVPASSVALFTPNSSTPVQPLPGLSGRCNALYCDKDSSTVYVGGDFMGANSTNALAWTSQWVNLPFAGFNGPVHSITKNRAGNIVFGGQFDGLGNSSGPRIPNQQVINIGGSNITASGTTALDGYSAASSIVCKTGSQAGPGNTWLLADNTAGWWQASFGFGFIPTKLRLYNANIEGRGTKTFYFEDMNSGGILNMTYQDASGNLQSCTNMCPLQNNANAQDFYFTPTVGMNMFRIFVTDWYGPGGGFSGIEMFQDDIYSFAINTYNEPQCGVTKGSSSLVTPASGTWTTVPLSGSADAADSGYLMADLTDQALVNSGISVSFRPDIKQSGNYSVTVWTPGCIQDNSCGTRGQVNVTGVMSPNSPPFSTVIYQTNNYGKYDQVYYGYIDADPKGAFQPSVTLSPVAGQQVPLKVVAQKVRFDLITSTGGLNGLFEYNPNEATMSTDFSNSAIDKAGASLSSQATVNSVLSYQGSIYAAGSFTAAGIANVLRIDTNASSVSNGGLNGAVLHAYQNDSLVYYGGSFTGTADNSTTGLNHVAAYSLTDDKWIPLGAGVDGNVSSIVPLKLNISNDATAECIAISGDFSSVYAFAGTPSFPASGFAVWVVHQSNWLHNLANTTISVTGDLTAYTQAPNESFWAGTVVVRTKGTSDVVQLVNSGTSFRTLGVQLGSSNATTTNTPTIAKRASSNSTIFSSSGVYAGLYYYENNLNITVLGGAFSATASNGTIVRSLAFVNNTGSQQTITGISSLSSDSVITSVDTQDTLLFAGGNLRGSVNDNNVDGLVVFDLRKNSFASPQPPALGGGNVTVSVVRAQPSSSNIWIGGAFDFAGSLPCGTLCVYSTSSLSWNSPGNGLTGTVNAMAWSSNTDLIYAGNLTISGNVTTVGTYNTKSQVFQQLDGASALPGPVTAMSSAMDGTFWVAGIATNNNSIYLSKYSSGSFTAASGLNASSTIRGLQVMPVTSNHANTALISGDEVLLISGNIGVSGSASGNASAVLFNGTTFVPYLITSKDDGGQSSIAGIFVSNPTGFSYHASHQLALGLVVLIGLAIALGLIFLIVVAGILLERRRRRNEGYVPMDTNRDANLARVPPSSLLARLGDPAAAPRI